MTPEAHAAFTAALRDSLARDSDVLGLVTLGSSSGLPPSPDDFSDHDFFVVVREGAQERFRTDLSWMPHASDIALSFRETAHGLKVLYASGHLAEFAVFDLDELSRFARVNRYAVLLDRADVEARITAARGATVAAAAAPDGAWHAGMFVTNLVVGVGRAARGEVLSGHSLVRVSALSHLLTLLHAGHRAAHRDSPLDDLDPHRRFERALPEAALAIGTALQLPVPEAARGLLAVAETHLPGLIPPRARDALAAVLARVTPAAPPPAEPPPTALAPSLLLETPRLRLRPLVEDDVAALWPLVSLPELPRYMSWSAHLDPQETLDFARRSVAGRLEGHDLKWIIEHDGRVAGLVGLDDVTWQFRAWRLDRAELGYWLDPTLWGRGLMTEAAGAAVRFGFDVLGLHKITVGCIEENRASRRVIEKLGFRFVGRQVDDVWREGRWWAHLRWELTRREYAARSG